jgi:hypothetical protein
MHVCYIACNQDTIFSKGLFRMTLTSTPNAASTAAAFGFRMTANERRMGRLMRDEGGHTDEGDGRREVEETDEQKATREAAEAAAAAAASNSDDKDAALTAANEELERLRALAASFDGIDPAVARANAEKVAKAEKDAAAAAKAARDAEKARAAAENDVAKLREIQNEEHTAAIAAVTAERDQARQEAQDVRSEITRLRTENAFANSQFITEDTILSPAKAQRLFGDYVEVEDGQVVVYDAPRGDAKRARVQDSKGKSLPFNDAIAKVINADSDKDTLLKSKVTPGAGSKTTDGKPPVKPTTGLDKLRAGIAARRASDARG